MKHVLLFLLLLLSVSLSAQDIKTFVSHQMAVYPKSHLLDLYKSCFQDYMGAEHLVSDRERVRAYLDEELNTTDINELPKWYYEPCGIEGRYVRVSLRTVREGPLRRICFWMLSSEVPTQSGHLSSPGIANGIRLSVRLTG